MKTTESLLPVPRVWSVRRRRGRLRRSEKRKERNIIRVTLTARGVGRRTTATVHTSIVVHMLTTRRVSCRCLHAAGASKPAEETRMRCTPLHAARRVSLALPGCHGVAGLLHSHHVRRDTPVPEASECTNEQTRRACERRLVFAVSGPNRAEQTWSPLRFPLCTARLADANGAL